MTTTVMYVRLPVGNRFAARHGTGHRVAAVAFTTRGNRLHIGYSVCMPEDRFTPHFDINITKTLALASMTASKNHRSVLCARSFTLPSDITKVSRALRGLTHCLARNWRIDPQYVLTQIENCMASEVQHA